jgi:uncharacterized protein YegL
MYVVYINLGDTPNGPEIAINLVVDDSGSMAGDPIAQVRDALREFLEKVPEGARIGLIGFGSDVHVYAEPTEYREFLLDQIPRFEGRSGCTMLYDAVGEACNRFAQDERHRYVLVLTDGGDTGSKNFSLSTSPTKKTSLIAHANSLNAKIFAIGFGAADRSSLEQLATGTGGCYLEASGVADLAKTLQDALKLIKSDRLRIRLRPEFTRLIRETTMCQPPWLRHFSIDEWNESSIFHDESHLFFPKGTLSSVGSYCEDFEHNWRDTCRDILEQLALNQASTDLVFDVDVDLVIVGWLPDPAFRGLSFKVLDLFREVKKRLGAQLPGQLYPVLMPLIHQTGKFSRELGAECYAWYTAAHNHGGHRLPKCISASGMTNQHRHLNQHGWVALGHERILSQTANSLRSLALNPSLITRATAPRDDGQLPVQSIGSASLCAPLSGTRQKVILVSLRSALKSLLEGEPAPGEPVQMAQSAVEACRLELESIKSEILQPIELEAPEGILASVRLDYSRFWPPPPEMSEEDYLALLPLLLEERASEYLYRKLEALKRAIQPRADRHIESAKASISYRIDSLLFGTDHPSLRTALAFLEFLRKRLEEEKTRIRIDSEASVELERMRLFGEDERAVRTEGHLAREEALEKLIQLIRNRPRLEALAARHGFLAVLLGVVSEGVLTFLLPATWGIAGFSMPSVIGVLAGAITVGVGAVRWRHSRQRIGIAVREYVGALVRGARAAAIQECLLCLESILKALADWIGKTEEIPEWKPEEVRNESSLSQKQIVYSLGETLKRGIDLLQKRLQDNPAVVNPSVWELGMQVQNPSGKPESFSLKSSGLDDAIELSWSRLAPLAENGQWRRSCRRRLCSELQEYLDFHQERLELLRRIWGHGLEEFARLEIKAKNLGSLLRKEDFKHLADVLAGLEAIAFPPIELGDVPNIVQPDRYWIAEPGVFHALLVNHEGNAAVISGLTRGDLVAGDATWELHRLWHLDAHVPETRDWESFRKSWETFSENERRGWLAAWGDDPIAWVDPARGMPCFAPATPAPGDPSGESEMDEGGL